MQFYVKPTSNCGGFPLTSVEVLSPVFEADSFDVVTGEDAEVRTIVGWTDLFFGSPCVIQAFWGIDEAGNVGCIVIGGNSGVRVLAREGDEDFREVGVDDHLPNGWGFPFLVIEDEDIPDEILAVIGEKPIQ